MRQNRPAISGQNSLALTSYYEMKIPNATCLAQRYGITRQAADKRLKKIEEKIKKLVAIF